MGSSIILWLAVGAVLLFRGNARRKKAISLRRLEPRKVEVLALCIKRTYFFGLPHLCPNYPEDYPFYLSLHPFTLRKTSPSPPLPLTTKSDMEGKMASAAYQNPPITINRNVGNVTSSYNNVWNNCQISNERREILEWLSPMTPRERHQAVSEDRIGGVGNWLLGTSEFEKWHTSKDQAVNPVLFCYGDPGVGKTYLRCVNIALLEFRWRAKTNSSAEIKSSLVIDTLCDTFDGSSVAVACVYCDFHAHKSQSATGVVAALLKQLVAGVEPIPEEIRKAFERAKEKVDGRALRLSEICMMLIKSVSSLRRGFICIDALDEFPIKHRPELWDSLQNIVRKCPNIRLFITGRPHIREEVEKYFPGYPDLSSIKPTEEDIREYVTMRLRRDLESDAMDPELEADILTIIPEKISGA